MRNRNKKLRRPVRRRVTGAPRANLRSDPTGPAIALCARLGVSAQLPAPDEMVAITAGVVEGEPVEGVRCHPKDHLSGWFLFASSYSGDSDPDDFSFVHACHLFEERPEIAAFLALPAGWRFETDRPGRAWFDPVAAQDAAGG